MKEPIQGPFGKDGILQEGPQAEQGPCRSGRGEALRTDYSSHSPFLCTTEIREGRRGRMVEESSFRLFLISHCFNLLVISNKLH